MAFRAVSSVAILEMPFSACMASIIIPVAKAMRTEACRKRVSGGASKLRLNMQLSLMPRLDRVWSRDVKAASIDRHDFGHQAVIHRRSQCPIACDGLTASVVGWPNRASSSIASSISMLVIVRRLPSVSAFGNESGRPTTRVIPFASSVGR